MFKESITYVLFRSGCWAGSVKEWVVFILFPFILYALQCMSYLSVERDQWLTACYHWVVMLWFWYSIESSRDLSVLISVICCSDLKFFDDFWYKVNEIQENKVRMLLDRTLISPPFSLTFQAFIYSSSPMFLDAFLTLRSASFPLCGQGLILFLYLSHPLLLSFWFSFSVIIFPAVSRLLLFLYQPQHPQPLNPG